MAGNNQLYSLLYCTIASSLLTEHASLDMKRVGGGQLVMTVAKGFAGISPGAPMCTINVTNAIPAAGFEYDAGKAIEGYLPVEMGVANSAGKEAKSYGFILEDDLKHAVNSESTYSFSFTGTFPQFL